MKAFTAVVLTANLAQAISSGTEFEVISYLQVSNRTLLNRW